MAEKEKEKNKDQEKSKIEITSWSDVDQALKTLGMLDFEIEQKEGRLTAVIQKAQERYQPIIEDKSRMADEIVAAIQDYARRHKEDFDGKQCKVLNFGEVKFKLGKPSLAFIRPEEEIANDLLRMGEDKCIKVETTVIKNALKNLSKTVLKKIGIKTVPGALKWFINAYREKIVPTDKNEGLKTVQYTK